MLSLFSNLSSTFNVSRKLDKIYIDNAVAKLHYRVTSVILLVATICLCAFQYFGNVIECVQDGASKIPTHLMNTYCLYFGTFSLKEKNPNFPGHSGIGPYVDIGSLNHNTYYQWVPFYLFFLACTFYAPHFFWKIYEGGKLQSILCGFELTPYAITNLDICGIPTQNERNKMTNDVANYLWLTIKHKLNRNWGMASIITEISTLVHVLFAYWLTNLFLGGNYIFSIFNYNAFSDVFPTLTMCTFHTYGPTGNIQRHESICLLALNNVNEKVFWILQFWFPILISVTVVAVIWRFICMMLYRSLLFNRFIFKQDNDNDVGVIINVISFSDWLFLCYISMNLNSFVFKDVYGQLAQNIVNECKEMRKKMEASISTEM